MVMARLINKPTTLDYLGYPYFPIDWSTFEMRTRQAAKELRPFWGNAYVVTTHGQPIDKLSYLLGVLEAAHKRLPLTGIPPTCQAYHSAFKTLEGFADFMAAQVVADLKNTSFHPLANAPDWWTFVAPGPGSKRGMNWYYRNEITTSISTQAFRCNIEDIQRTLEGQIPKLCNQDLQNCLCEFDKYMRVKTGSGRSKRGYNGR